MLKLFDWDNLKVVKMSNKKCNAMRLALPNGFYSLPIKTYAALIHKCIQNELDVYCNNSNLIPYLICVTDEKLNKEDFEILYDIIISCFTKCIVTTDKREDREYRLGGFTQQEKINMNLSHIKKWLNFQVKNSIVGLELVKTGSFWKKRMVK